MTLNLETKLFQFSLLSSLHHFDELCKSTFLLINIAVTSQGTFYTVVSYTIGLEINCNSNIFSKISRVQDRFIMKQIGQYVS